MCMRTLSECLRMPNISLHGMVYGPLFKRRMPRKRRPSFRNRIYLLSDRSDGPASLDIFENVCILWERILKAIWMQTRDTEIVGRYHINHICGISKTCHRNIINHILADLWKKLRSADIKKVGHLDARYGGTVATLVESTDQCKCIHKRNLWKYLFGYDLFWQERPKTKMQFFSGRLCATIDSQN